MSRSEFVEKLNSLTRVYSSEIYTPADVATKIARLKSGKPCLPQKEVTKWKRLHERFKLLSYQGTNILYLRERKNHPAKQSEFSQLKSFLTLWRDCTKLKEIIQAELGYTSVRHRNSTVLLRECVTFSLKLVLYVT